MEAPRESRHKLGGKSPKFGHTGSAPRHYRTTRSGSASGPVEEHQRPSRFYEQPASQTLPLEFRSKLYGLFRQIEEEFEGLYAENLSLHDKVSEINERLDSLCVDKSGLDVSDFHVTSSKVSADRSQLSGTGGKKSIQFGQKIKTTYKASTSKIVSSFKAGSTSGCHLVREYIGHRDGIWDVASSTTVVATASADKTARVWCIKSGACLLQYSGHQGSVNSVRFRPAGAPAAAADTLLTASGDQTAHIWRTALAPHSIDTFKSHSSEDEVESSEKEDTDLDGEHGGTSARRGGGDSEPATVLRTPQLELTGHTSVVICADWLAGRDQIVTASWDRTANIYDGETGKLVQPPLQGHDQELTFVCSHPSQHLVMTSSKDGSFRMWDVRLPSANSVVTCIGHGESVTSAIFSPAGDKVISGSDDRTVKIWDTKTFQHAIHIIKSDSAINRLSVSTGSQQLIAVPHDNRHVRLYDLHANRLARLPRTSHQGHKRMVCATAWNNDFPECKLLTCGFDRRVLGWQVSCGNIVHDKDNN